MWTPCRLVFDAAGNRGNRAACGLHAASSLTPQERVEAGQRVDSTLPRLRCRRKAWKRGGVWTPHRLVLDATGRINEAACGFHAVSSSMPQKGGETTRRRVGFTRPRFVLGSSLVLAPTPPLFHFLSSGCWHHRIGHDMGDGDGGGDDVAPTSLNEGRGSRWLGGSRRGVLMWCDLKKIQHAWFITKQTYLVT